MMKRPSLILALLLAHNTTCLLTVPRNSLGSRRHRVPRPPRSAVTTKGVRDPAVDSAGASEANDDDDGCSTETAEGGPTVRRFYLLRHGQTDLNAAGVIQGSSDVSRLTDLGRRQAREAGQGLAQLLKNPGPCFAPDLPLAAVFSSNVSRAIETMCEVKDEWAANPEIRRGDFGSSSTYMSMLGSLREIDLGEWEVRSKKELAASYPDQWAQWGRDPARFTLPLSGRRPVVELWARAAEAWQQVRGAGPGFATDAKSKPSSGSKPSVQPPQVRHVLEGVDPDRRVLVIGHNAVNQALLCTACGLGPETFRRYGFRNGGVCEIEWADEEPLARRWRWVLPEKTGWFHILANPTIAALKPPAMNQQEALAAAQMDNGAPCVVWVRPRDEANVGAVAQAMLNFGLSELRLVDPFADHLGVQALERAGGARAVLEKAKVYPSVAAATKGLTLTLAATASANRAPNPTTASAAKGGEEDRGGGGGGGDDDDDEMADSRAMFDSYDLDGDGRISATEMGRAVAEAGLEMSEAEVAALFAQLLDRGDNRGGEDRGEDRDGATLGLEAFQGWWKGGEVAAAVGALAVARVAALPAHSPRTCAAALRDVAARNQKGALMLGSEGYGLRVADLQLCGGVVHVPTHPAFASLNIAGALTILAYESWIARNGDRVTASADGVLVADLNIAPAAPEPPPENPPPSPYRSMGPPRPANPGK